MLLTGTFSRAVDEKLRIAIPKPLRDALGALAKGVLYITPGTDGSLALYTEDALAALAERLANSSPNAQDVRAFSRLFYARRKPSSWTAKAGFAFRRSWLNCRDWTRKWC